MKMICGNADTCFSKGCNRNRPHKRVKWCGNDGCTYHTAKKGRPCVPVTSKRGAKVLKRLGKGATDGEG